MARIEESVEIKRPVEKVFAYTTDASNCPKWQSILPQSEQTSRGPVGVGTTFKGKCHMMGLTLGWTAKATECEPNKNFSRDITSAAMLIKQHSTYSPAAEGVKFNFVYDVKVRGVFNLFSPMLISTMRKELKKSLGNLKGILEAQA